MIVLTALGLLSAIAIGIFLLMLTVGLVQSARRKHAALAPAAKHIDVPFTAETRNYVLKHGTGIGFNDRVAFCRALDQIAALPEANVPALSDDEGLRNA